MGRKKKHTEKNKTKTVLSLNTMGHITLIYFVITGDALHFTASGLTLPRGTIMQIPATISLRLCVLFDCVYSHNPENSNYKQIL